MSSRDLTASTPCPTCGQTWLHGCATEEGHAWAVAASRELGLLPPEPWRSATPLRTAPDAWIDEDELYDLVATGGAALVRRNAYDDNDLPLYSPRHPMVLALIEAAKLQVLNFTRQAKGDGFLGDDDHEAWTALTVALAPWLSKEKTK